MNANEIVVASVSIATECAWWEYVSNFFVGLSQPVAKTFDPPRFALKARASIR